MENPKDIIGSNKIPLHLWPVSASIYGCLGMLDGAKKYGRNNFRLAGIKASLYVDACMRHLLAWFEGEDTDLDSGLHHLCHALATLAIIVECIESNNLIDDRNYPSEFRKTVDKLTPHVLRLKQEHVNTQPYHYIVSDMKKGTQEVKECWSWYEQEDT